jgi:hypothetical protein
VVTPKVKKPRAAEGHSWAVSKTMQADGKGAAKLTKIYGDSLVCVRYRLSPDGKQRITTVELIVDQSPVQNKANPTVFVKIYPSETELITLAKAKGARYNAKTRLWRMTTNDAISMNIKERIASDHRQN